MIFMIFVVVSPPTRHNRVMCVILHLAILRMRDQCVPGSPFLPRIREPGDEATVSPIYYNASFPVLCFYHPKAITAAKIEEIYVFFFKVNKAL